MNNESYDSFPGPFTYTPKKRTLGEKIQIASVCAFFASVKFGAPAYLFKALAGVDIPPEHSWARGRFAVWKWTGTPLFVLSLVLTILSIKLTTGSTRAACILILVIQFAWAAYCFSTRNDPYLFTR